MQQQNQEDTTLLQKILDDLEDVRPAATSLVGGVDAKQAISAIQQHLMSFENPSSSSSMSLTNQPLSVQSTIASQQSGLLMHLGGAASPQHSQGPQQHGLLVQQQLKMVGGPSIGMQQVGKIRVFNSI